MMFSQTALVYISRHRCIAWLPGLLLWHLRSRSCGILLVLPFWGPLFFLEFAKQRFGLNFMELPSLFTVRRVRVLLSVCGLTVWEL